jgi:ankyrin repeat protein
MLSQNERRPVGLLGLLLVALVGWMPLGPSDVADAAMLGDRVKVEALLKSGADVNAAQGDGMTALHWAAERADAQMANMLIRAGANVGAVTRIGEYTPLHLASRTGSAPLIGMLLEAGARPNARTTNSGVMPLHFAAASGSAEAVTLLLDKGAEVDPKEISYQQTPLIFAASLNRTEVIRVLLAKGANPNHRTWTQDDVRRAQDAAAAKAQGDMLDAFRTATGADPTPSQVQAAIAAGRAARLAVANPSGPVEAMAEAPNPDPDFVPTPTTDRVPPGSLSALHHAARQGYVEAARALIDGGADVNIVTLSDRTTPLLQAVQSGQWDVAVLLIERGADPNISNTTAGLSPLWATINTRWQSRPESYPQPQEMDFQQHSYLEVMEALLAAGADPDHINSRQPFQLQYGGCGNSNCGFTDLAKITPIFRAANSADVDAMRLLVSYGADPRIPRGGPGATLTPPPPQRGGGAGPGGRAADAGGRGGELPNPVNTQIPAAPASVIHAAAGLGFGQGVGAGNANRFMPNGWLPAVKYLVEELGFDVNARDDGGFTPLHFAAARGDHELILWLVEKGADVQAVSRTGYTTADMANGPQPRITPMPATVALLVSLGSKNSNNCRSC